MHGAQLWITQQDEQHNPFSSPGGPRQSILLPYATEVTQMPLSRQQEVLKTSFIQDLTRLPYKKFKYHVEVYSHLQEQVFRASLLLQSIIGVLHDKRGFKN